MGNTSDTILSGILGAVLFFVSLFFFSIDIIPSILIGGAGFGAGLFLFTRKKQEVIDSENEIKDVVQEGKTKLIEIQKFQLKIEKPAVVSKIKEICSIIKQILDDLEKDPNDLKAARQFLGYYLDSTIKILNLYSDLSLQKVTDQKIKDSLLKVEGMLQNLRDAFEKKLAQLLHNDVMDLDTELSLLKQTINMDGLGSDN